MRAGVVHTEGTPTCICAASIAEGLRELGHEPVIVDCEDVPWRVVELRQSCTVAFDHSDTFRKEGILRSFPRWLLEAHGIVVPGSTAAACLACDSKLLTKRRLREAGVPVPDGVVVAGEAVELPDDLEGPLVLKCAYEHMSRGLTVVRSREEALRTAVALSKEYRQPVLAERLIDGREVKVGVIPAADGSGFEVLPPVEWEDARPGQVMLFADKSERAMVYRPAQLAPDAWERIRMDAVRAAEALAIREYARFDVRVDPAGKGFFLEANAVPSMGPRESLAAAAAAAGISYSAFIDRLLQAALRRAGA